MYYSSRRNFCNYLNLVIFLALLPPSLSRENRIRAHAETLACYDNKAFNIERNLSKNARSLIDNNETGAHDTILVRESVCFYFKLHWKVFQQLSNKSKLKQKLEKLA